MNPPSNSSLIETALTIRPGRFLLVVTSGRQREKVTELVAGLALRGPLDIVAGSDWLPGDALARSLRRRTVDVIQVLERICLARAFTCYQLADLLGVTLPNATPLLVLDFLHTFYSPDIPLPVRFQVFRRCCLHLERLSWYKPVAVLVQQSPQPDYAYFQPFLAAVADEVLLPESGPDQPSQSSLL